MMNRRSILSGLLLISLLVSASSCFLSRDPNRASRGKRFPHDEHRGEKKQ
jgi:hypothetical protein